MQNFYQQLEISPQATAKEIKRSYFRLVRQYSPEKVPERFKLIREAYEVLKDEKARANYDAMREHGEQINELISTANQKMSEEKWDEAVPLFKKVLVLLPSENGSRNMLGICLTRLEDWYNALKAYRKLTQNADDVPLYWSNYGVTFRAYAQSLEKEDPKRANLFKLAREQYKKAIDLESYNSEWYLAIARTYSDENNYPKALIWADRAVGADGKADLDDFEALFYICQLHLYSGEYNKIQVVAKRIIALMPEDNEDVRKIAAAKFYNFGIELLKAGYEGSNVGLFKAAKVFVDAAKLFDADDTDINKVKGNIDNLLKAYDEYDNVGEDSQLASGFSALAAFCLADALNEDFDDKEETFKNIVVAIFNNSSDRIVSSVQRIRRAYPAIYKLKESMFDDLEKAGQDKKSKKNCFLTSACVSYAGLPDDCFELETLRAFRDGYLASIPEGPALIREYYEVAPSLVAFITLDEKRHLVLSDILTTVRECVQHIINYRYEEALVSYKAMYLGLKSRYL